MNTKAEPPSHGSTEKGLAQVARFLADLKKSPEQMKRQTVVITPEVAALYAEVSEDDSAGAGKGLGE